MSDRQPQRRRVLIVTSAYVPAMVADMHRARMLAWQLPRLGWDVEILTADAAFHRQELVDDSSPPFSPPDLPVHRAPVSIASRALAAVGIRAVAWRAGLAMERRGRALLKSGRFDLVYVSTTNFPLMCLAPRWKSRTGTPYVLDFHDPWYRPGDVAITTPHRWKWRANRLLARRLERYAVVGADGLVAVSPDYIDELSARYGDAAPGWMAGERHAAIPFGGSPQDLAIAASTPNPWRERFNDGLLHVVYVGAGGPIMRRAMLALCRALRDARARLPELVGRLRFHLHGTTPFWKPGDERYLQQVAHSEGVGELFDEQPGRVGYLDSLHMAQAAAGLLVLGVDDPGYVPSKLINYLLVGSPVLGVFHDQSPVRDVLRRDLPDTSVLWFDGNHDDRPLDQFLEALAAGRRHDRAAALADQLDTAMAARHMALFEACLDRASSPLAPLDSVAAMPSPTDAHAARA